MSFLKVAAGNKFAVGILEPSTLTLWGTNTFMKEKFVPSETAKDVFAGKDIVFVINQDGYLIGFGSTANERLPIPVEIQSPKSVEITDNCVIVVEESGQLKAWGSGAAELVPTQLTTEKVVSISHTGTDFSALLENGTVVQWSSKINVQE
jgi:alpha-tubulin suppressor-like RCC1 family protein